MLGSIPHLAVVMPEKYLDGVSNTIPRNFHHDHKNSWNNARKALARKRHKHDQPYPMIYQG